MRMSYQILNLNVARSVYPHAKMQPLFADLGGNPTLGLGCFPRLAEAGANRRGVFRFAP